MSVSAGTEQVEAQRGTPPRPVEELYSVVIRVPFRHSQETALLMDDD